MARSAAFILIILYSIISRALGVELTASTWIEQNPIEFENNQKQIRSHIYGGNAIVDQWWTTKRNRYGFSTGLGYGRVHAKNKQDDFTFKQTYVPAYWAIFSPTYRYRKTTAIELGVAGVFMYRQIKFLDIPGSYTINEKNKLLMALGLEMVWNFSSNLNFIQRMNLPITAGLSPTWNFGLGWDL